MNVMNTTMSGRPQLLSATGRVQVIYDSQSSMLEESQVYIDPRELDYINKNIGELEQEERQEKRKKNNYD